MTEPKPSDHAVHFEAVKIAMNQTRDGWKLVLAVHPDEAPEEVLRSLVGSRYMVALVELQDNEEPKPLTRAPMDEAKRDAVWAAELCREPAFQRWMWFRLADIGEDSQSEEATANRLRAALGIQSRSEISTNPDVRRRFRELAQSYLDGG